MTSFDLCDVQEACAAAHEHSSRETEFRDAEETSFVHTASTVLDALTALEEGSDPGVMLPSLEAQIRTRVWILVVQTIHHACEERVVPHVIHEGAGVVGSRDGGSHRVEHKSFLVMLVTFRKLPDFLDPQTVGLRVAILSQIEPAGRKQARDKTPKEKKKIEDETDDLAHPPIQPTREEMEKWEQKTLN